MFNALLGRDAAITAPLAGTTRDYLTATIDVEGLAVELFDAAGRMESCNTIQGEGGPADSLQSTAEARAERLAEGADIELFCVDGSRRLDDWERRRIERPDNSTRVLVVTKSDLPRRLDPQPSEVAVSSKTGEGLDRLRSAIRLRVRECRRGDGTVFPGTALRCESSLRAAAECLGRAAQLAPQPNHEDLVAAEVRAALLELGKVVGAVYTDDILDRIF